MLYYLYIYNDWYDYDFLQFNMQLLMIWLTLLKLTVYIEVTYDYCNCDYRTTWLTYTFAQISLIHFYE